LKKQDDKLKHMRMSNTIK